MKNFINIRKKKFGSSEIWTPVPWTKGQSCTHITSQPVENLFSNFFNVIMQSKLFMAGDSKFWKLYTLMLFFGKFYVTKKSKNVEIVFSIPKAKSGSIAIKIRQPFLWTDPHLPGLIWIVHFFYLKYQGCTSRSIKDASKCLYVLSSITKYFSSLLSL